MRKKILLLLMPLALVGAYFVSPLLQSISSRVIGASADIDEVRHRVGPALKASLTEMGLQIGAPTYIRVFKEEHQLEVWLQMGDTYKLFKSYQICNYSGDLGPKLQEGDHQSPEGFYTVDKSAMNPNSNYHLSFNVGFPNAYDQSHSRSGSFLMIHGNCVSIGCYAMTDQGIEEIYLITEAAQKAGQNNVPVHAFPFRMTSERLKAERENPWHSFWKNLKTGYDLFEQELVPPFVSVSGQEYVFEAG